MTSKKTIKAAFEAMMFVWGEPLPAKAAAELFDISLKEACDCFEELKEEYEREGRGIRIREVDKRFQFVTDPGNAEYVRRLCAPVKEKRLSQAALEVLAIVAYKQPVTKGEVEAIRGIKCDRVLEGLMKKELICEAGRSGGIGRPILYGTTPGFLKLFGFRNIRELPDIENLEEVIGADGEDCDGPGPVELGQMAIDLFSAGEEKAEEES